MKVLRILFLILIIMRCFFSVGLAHADWRLVLIPEILSVGDADKHFKEAAQYDAALVGGSSSVKANAGYGIRVGLMKPTTLWNNTFVGGTLGYYVGPQLKRTIETSSPFAGTFGDKVNNYYVRGLAEGVHFIPLSSSLGIKLGAGVGIARGTTKQTSFFTGSYPGNSSQRTQSDIGFTWEISPALVINLQATVLELGLRYMQFPTIKGTDQTAEIDWTPFGFYVGLGF